MSKPRKRDSRRPSKKKIEKMEKRKKVEEMNKEYKAKRERYTIPENNTELAIEQCKKRILEEGKLCYCKEKCGCRMCPSDCSLEVLKQESMGCFLGCYSCSEHSPCY